MLISSTIPNLVNGVSQQPASLRLASQCEEQVNAYSSVVEGLKKRAPTKHRAKIIDGILGEAFVHTINRDVTERYKVVITDEDIQVFDLDTGDEKTVTPTTNTALAYLASNTADTSFRAVTIADHTFVVNKDVTVNMAANTTANLAHDGLVYIRQGNYGTTYKVFVDGAEEATYTTSNTDVTDIATDNIADELRAQLATNLGGAPWTFTREGSTIRLVHASADFALAASDSNGDRNVSVIKGQLQKFTDLPNVAPHGFIVHITGDPGAQEDDYYVEFKANDEAVFSRGVWEESVAPGIPYKFDATTMPHVLIRQSNGTFTFGPATWDDREVGDEESIPEPSFVGITINDVFFYRGRLAFLADENVICSRAGGEFFNFWRASATVLLDSDPVDVAAAHTKVSILKNGVPLGKRLLLFSDQTQFELDPGDLLTPKSAAIDPTTEFENSTLCRPILVGKNVYFAVPKDAFAGVREYFVDEDTQTKDAADITSHVPAYIPAGVFKLTVATNEDVLLALTHGDPGAIYVYKFYWAGDEKLQSSWSRWTFSEDPDVKVLNADFVDMDLVLLLQREDGVYLEVLNVAADRRDEDLDYEVLLDRRLTDEECDDVAYNTETDKTTWTLPYEESETMRVVTRPGGDEPEGVVLTITRPTADTIAADGDWTAQPVYIGKVFSMEYTFSEFNIKEKQSSGAEAPITAGRLQILRGSVLYSNSGYFRVEVTPRFNDTFVYPFTGRILGSGNNVIGATGLETGRFKFPVMSKNDRVTIRLINDSHLPSRIQSAEWEGNLSMRSRRF